VGGSAYQKHYEPKNSNINWYKWRPIIEKITTLEEVETFWTIDDLADANEALNLKADAEDFYVKQSRRGK